MEKIPMKELKKGQTVVSAIMVTILALAGLGLLIAGFVKACSQ